METPLTPCLDAHTFAALVRPGAVAGDLKHAAEHLLGTPGTGGCRTCRDHLAALFLAASDPEDREAAAAGALREGSCTAEPELLRQILQAEPADADTLVRWERWQETRDGAADPQAVPAVILASSALRFEPGAPGLLSHARLAVAMADAAGDPWLQSIAQSWLTRVRSIRGELREAARALDAAQKAAERLDGEAHAMARAYALYQSADLRMRVRDFAAARERFERSAEMFRRLDPPGLAHYPEIGLVHSLTEGGQWEEAREVLRGLLGASRDRLMIQAGLQGLMGEILPNLAREGEPGLAERALCLRIVAGESRQDLGIRARAFWRDGRIAWALGAHETALAFYREARSLFLSAAPDVAGRYEAASISLDALGVMLRWGPPREAQAFALEAANDFAALGADTSCLLALGSVRQLEVRTMKGAGAHALAHARIALELTEKRRLNRAAGEGA
jgi:hypothetical protein